MSLARATWDSGAETWIVFYGSCVKRYRAFEVLRPPAPRATGWVQRGSPFPLPRDGGVTSQPGKTHLCLEHGVAGGKDMEGCRRRMPGWLLCHACSRQPQKPLSEPFY